MFTHKFEFEGIDFPKVGELVFEEKTHAVLEVTEKTEAFKNKWMLAKCRPRPDVDPMKLSEEMQGSFNIAIPLK